MILIAAADDSYGMMFNHRRQSQDRVLRQRMLELTAGHTLWMNAYSAKQFAEITIIRLFDKKLFSSMLSSPCLTSNSEILTINCFFNVSMFSSPHAIK